ncbi:cytochrome P450 [Roridomyces roridus]|uniref:Cytochrome P450 n=1 Tax=Roridomyces roridus TaxID=1738132 RepID=A0AAD7BFY6_9AGAR|nr:cytochrome P450 [Roridomyces roridus]
MALTSLEFLTLFSVISCAVLYFSPQFLHAKLPLPPGPKSQRWIPGSVDMPKIRPWLTYAPEWRKLYGDLIYIRVLGNPILVLNSVTVASDLLEKRSSKYSSRPVRTMVVELMGCDWFASSFPYGPYWQKHRAMFQRYLPQNDSSIRWHPLQTQEAHALLCSLFLKPAEFRHHIRTLSASIVLKMTYGVKVGTGNEYVVLADQAIAGLAEAGIFGTYLVDYIPWLKYAPSWFSFKRKARAWRKLARAMVNVPFASVQQEMAQGVASKCLVSEELEGLSNSADPTMAERIIKNVAGTMYAAGADTTSSALAAFFLAITIHPEIQQRGQAEIDRVIGHGQRLPLFTDRPQLAFIDYICYELLRWNPVGPLGLPHYDDEYRGFRIPKGTTVLPNIWAILHDPETYPDPLAFNPSRFSPEDRTEGKNPLPDVAFGFGRRFCPGRFLAFDTIWIAVASILTVYDISKSRDETGAVKEPTVEFTPHMLSHPVPFVCTITPRSAAAAQLVQDIDMSL